MYLKENLVSSSDPYQILDLPTSRNDVITAHKNGVRTFVKSYMSFNMYPRYHQNIYRQSFAYTIL